jgi:SAM-dependent methyltransferase
MARRRLQRSTLAAELVAGYAQDLPFPNEAFDLVVSTLTFHHLPGPVKVAALREVRRVLAPHGRFLLVDFGMPDTRIAQVLLRIGSLFDGRENMRANLAGELPVMLAAAGFAVHEVSHPHRGVRHLLARPQHAPRSDRSPARTSVRPCGNIGPPTTLSISVRPHGYAGELWQSLITPIPSTPSGWLMPGIGCCRPRTRPACRGC